MPAYHVPTRRHDSRAGSCSVVETIPNPGRHLSRHVEMRAPEGVAFIEKKTRLRHVQRRHEERPPLPECLAALEIAGRVRRLVRRAVALEESRPLGYRRRRRDAGAEVHVETGREGIALIVVEEEEAFSRGFERRKSAADGASTLDKLMGVRHVHLRAPAAR